MVIVMGVAVLGGIVAVAVQVTVEPAFAMMQFHPEGAVIGVFAVIPGVGRLTVTVVWAARPSPHVVWPTLTIFSVTVAGEPLGSGSELG